MGPKAKGKPAKKKDGGAENGEELTPEQKAQLFMLTCQSLQVQLAERTEEASKSIAARRELKARVDQIARDFDQEKTQTFEITQDMTRQYKAMQEDLLSRINKLEGVVQQLNDQLAESDARHEKILKEKNAIIQMKDDEINDLKAKMDDMADEFGAMLRETLEKMKERIEINTGGHALPDLPIQRRMEELK